MSPILGSIGGASEYSFRGNLDDISNEIVLENLTNVEPGVVGVATTTVTGLNYLALATVTGGAEFSVNAGAYTTLPKSIRNNQTLSVRFTTTSGTDADFSKTYNTTVAVGKKQTIWSVITRAKDATPTSFSFTTASNQNPGITTTSNSITISGLESSPPTFAFISSGIGSFRKNSVPGFSTTLVSNSDVIEIVAPTPNIFSSSNIVSFTVGTFTTSFTATTRDADKTVNSFSFTPVTNAGIGTSVTSDIATISGADNNVALASTISGSSGQVSVNSGSFISGTTNIFNGNTVRVRIPSRSIVSYGTTYNTTLNIAGVAGTFTVTTRERPVKTIPNQFTFTDVTAAAPETIIESNVITLSGMTTGDTGTATISGGNAEFKVIRNNVIVRNYSSSSYTVQNNDRVQLRITSAKVLENIQTTFTVSGTDTTTLPGTTGSKSDIWSVTSRDIICSTSVINASGFARFSNVESAELNTLYNTLVDFTGVDSKCNFYISVSNPDSYVENPSTGESGSLVAVPTIPSAGIRVWMRSSSSFNTLKTTTVSIYSLRNPSDVLTRTYSIITKQSDSTPDTFNLISRSVANVDPSTIQTTYVTQSLTGISPEISVPAFVEVDSAFDTTADFLISKNNGTFATSILGGVQLGDRIDIKGTSGSIDSIRQAKVTVGNITENWKIVAKPSVPQITFNVEPTLGNSSYSSSTSETNQSGDVVYITSVINGNLPYDRDIYLSWTTNFISTTSSTDSLILKLPYYNNQSNATIDIINTPSFSTIPLGFDRKVFRYSGGLPQNSDGTVDVEFLMTGTNFSGISTTKIIGKFNPPKPILSISASPTGSITYNTNYTLTWSSTYGDTVSESTNLGNTNNLNGSFTVLNARETKTHTISVRNATGTSTASITVNVNPCVPATTSTDSAIYTSGKIIYTNGSESVFDDYLTTIKDNSFTNGILDYPSRTTEYSSHKLKTVIYKIASVYQSRFNRPPTRTEVGRWLGEYQKGISAPYTFNFEITKTTQVPCPIYFTTRTAIGNIIGVTISEVTESVSNDSSFKKQVPTVGLIAGSTYGVRYGTPGVGSQYDSVRKYITTTTPGLSIISPGTVINGSNTFTSPSSVTGDTIGGEYFFVSSLGWPQYWDYLITLKSVTDYNGNSYGSSVVTNSFSGTTGSINMSFVFRLSSLTALESLMNYQLPPSPSLTENRVSKVVDTCGTTLVAVSNPGS